MCIERLEAEFPLKHIWCKQVYPYVYTICVVRHSFCRRGRKYTFCHSLLTEPCLNKQSPLIIFDMVPKHRTGFLQNSNVPQCSLKYHNLWFCFIIWYLEKTRSKYFIVVSMKIYQMGISYSYPWMFPKWQLHNFNFCHDWLNYKHSLFMQWPSLTPSNIPLLMCTIMNYVSTLELSFPTTIVHSYLNELILFSNNSYCPIKKKCYII